MLLIYLLLSFTFFFATFVAKEEKDQTDSFKTTYGILFLKYRYWITNAGLYLFYFLLHRISFVMILHITIVFSLMYLLLVILLLTWMSYLILCDTYLEKEDTRKDLVNAYMMTLFFYFVPAYTLMTPDA
jgi:hypothetical protein